MKNEDVDKIVLLTVITGKKQKDSILSALLESGARLVNTIYGWDTAQTSCLKSALGIASWESKVVITCVMTDEKSNVVLNMLVEKFKFDKPNTGIAFVIPIERISF